MSPAVDLLEGMLLLDPERRLTAKQGLSHPYLAEYHDPECEPDSDPYDDSFESLELAVGECKSEFGRFANRQQATALIDGATLYIYMFGFVYGPFGFTVPLEIRIQSWVWRHIWADHGPHRMDEIRLLLLLALLGYSGQ